MTPTPADRKREQRERGRQFLKLWDFRTDKGEIMTTAEPLLTAAQKFSIYQIENLRRWVEQANKKGN